MLAKDTLKKGFVGVVDFPKWRICVAVWVMEARGAAVFGKVLSSDCGKLSSGFPKCVQVQVGSIAPGEIF